MTRYRCANAIRNDALLRDAKSVACFSVRVRGLATATLTQLRFVTGI